LPRALESYKLYASTYPRDANALNNLGSTYQTAGDFEHAATSFVKTWEAAKWDNAAATNAAQAFLALDRLSDAERYQKESLQEGAGENPSYHSNSVIYGFLAGCTDWGNEVQWAEPRPGGFQVEGVVGDVNFFTGKAHLAGQHWEHSGQRAIQQHLPDAAGSFYALKAVHAAFVSDCATARSAAHRGLSVDRSDATMPNAALALALCGETGPAVQEMERLTSAEPANTLVNEVYLPQVKAAAALRQHHPEQVSELLTSVAPYLLVSKASQLLGLASLETNRWQQAIADFAPGLRGIVVSALRKELLGIRKPPTTPCAS